MLSKQHSLLHIIDVQGRLFDVMHDRENLRNNMVKLVKGINILEIPIVWMEQYPKGLGPTITELSELLGNNSPMEKMCFSSCRKPEFIEELRLQGRNQIIVMGIEAHVCVYQTVKGLLTRGFQVSVVADAISSRSDKNYQIGLRAMEAEGARITSVEMALFELLEGQ